MAEKVDKKAHISSPSLSNNEKKRKPTDADFRFSILIFGNKRTVPLLFSLCYSLIYNGLGPEGDVVGIALKKLAISSAVK